MPRLSVDNPRPMSPSVYWTSCSRAGEGFSKSRRPDISDPRPHDLPQTKQLAPSRACGPAQAVRIIPQKNRTPDRARFRILDKVGAWPAERSASQSAISKSAVCRLPCATDCSVSIAPLNCFASREGLDLAGRKVRANWLSFLPVRRFKARRIWGISHNPRTARPQLDAADRPVNPTYRKSFRKIGDSRSTRPPPLPEGRRLDLFFSRNDDARVVVAAARANNMSRNGGAALAANRQIFRSQAVV